MLANYLNNISVYWVAYGKKLAQVALSNGGSDLVGTAFSEESIVQVKQQILL